MNTQTIQLQKLIKQKESEFKEVLEVDHLMSGESIEDISNIAAVYDAQVSKEPVPYNAGILLDHMLHRKHYSKSPDSITGNCSSLKH